ncbi:MAG: hypothetical protein ACLGHY_11905 [Gammaproteobacteria bacterium]
MIQMRHVPDEGRRRLKARAVHEGMSLSDFLLPKVQGIVARPSVGELQARLAERAPVRMSESMAEAVRAERDSQ